MEQAKGSARQTCPPWGWAGFTVLTDKRPETSVFKYQYPSLETPYYRIRFDLAGRIRSLFDLRQERELVAEGGVFNGFITAEDIPVFWDAWDLDADWIKHITEETRLLATEVVADGPVCFRLRRKYHLGKGSTLVQDMVCYPHNPRIDFETTVSWHEK